MYKHKVLPWIQATPPQRLQWVSVALYENHDEHTAQAQIETKLQGRCNAESMLCTLGLVGLRSAEAAARVVAALFCPHDRAVSNNQEERDLAAVVAHTQVYNILEKKASWRSGCTRACTPQGMLHAC